ncbi:MAG TPA: tetratricopeptide repeat protein [Candidatus Sulfopaludibacter sp.]|nr:tetratricopeptide repeat protein [Candidatus Sulfopaludibacter sp.]
MSVLVRLNLLMVCACCVFGVGLDQLIFAAGTNSTDLSPRQAGDKIAQDSLNAFLQIQEQLHSTQLIIESNRVAAAAEAQRNAAEMTARIQVLEQTVATQRASEIEATQKAQRLTLILVGTFGLIGLAAVLFMAYFQWRTVTRLVELSPLHASALALENCGASPMLSVGEMPDHPGRAAVVFANARLFNVVERLEKRLLELEHLARAPLTGTASPPVDGHNGASPASTDHGRNVATLLAEGQSRLNGDEPEKALECFDQALALDPKSAEALIKKAGALEKLNRLEEAIVCYDDAIAADGTMTIAYLHKGGLFNRMSRYEEALQCYEHALHTHDQRTAGEKAAA